MDYISAKEASVLWNITDQMIRRHCRNGRIPGSIQRNGTWYVPADAKKPTKLKPDIAPIPKLVKQLQRQRTKKIYHGLFDYIQINFCYSSNRMASNRLTRNQVEEMYRTKRLTASFEPTKVDDIVEMMNHFICMRYVVDNITAPLTVSFVKQVHYFLTYGTYADQSHKTCVGEFRIKSDKLGVPPQQINKAVADLIKIYERKAAKLEQILAFHVQFERIHPFDDYNGRVGRILMVKECLRYGIDPFIIDDKRRGEYNRGIVQWDTNSEILQKVVCEAQKRFQNKLDTCRLMQYHRPPKK